MYAAGISCFSTKLCDVLGGIQESNKMIPVNPSTGKLGKVISLGLMNASGIACYSATQCITAGYELKTAAGVPATLVVTRGKPGKIVLYTFDKEPFNAVSCATAKLCYAVGPDSSGTTTQSIVVKV